MQAGSILSQKRTRTCLVEPAPAEGPAVSFYTYLDNSDVVLFTQSQSVKGALSRLHESLLMMCCVVNPAKG